MVAVTILYFAHYLNSIKIKLKHNVELVDLRSIYLKGYVYVETGVFNPGQGALVQCVKR